MCVEMGGGNRSSFFEFVYTFISYSFAVFRWGYFIFVNKILNHPTLPHNYVNMGLGLVLIERLTCFSD